MTAVPPLGETIATLANIAQVHGQPDLAASLGDARTRLTTDRFRVVVLGEYKRGKSSLINALLGASVTVVDDDVATATRVEVGFADPAGARIWRRAPDGERVVDDVTPQHAMAASVRDDVELIRIGLPRRLLRSGLVLADTPGIGGVSSAAAIVAASTLRDSHAAMFVTDASQELTGAELTAIADAVERCHRVVVVETKIDVAWRWRDIVAADIDHLRRHGLDVPLVAVSNALRWRALAAEDRRLNEESGFPQLIRILEHDLVGSAQTIVVDDARRTAGRAVQLLRVPLQREHRAMTEPSGADEGAGAALAEARSAATTFRERVQRWQQLLSDGITDLAADVDADLRERIRALVRDAEATIDASDPDLIWDEFEPAFYRSVAEALDANLELLREGADRHARSLANHLIDEYIDLGILDDAAPGESLAAEPSEWTTTDDRSPASRAQQAFRAGYGGAMPIMLVGGMALGVIGLGTLVLPLAGAAGLMAGRRALGEERQRRLQQRRQQAKVAVKRYAEDTMFRAAAERKQGQRRVQRALRDHFSVRVKELARMHQRTIEAAEAAVHADAARRSQRLAEVESELQRLDAIAAALADPAADGQRDG